MKGESLVVVVVASETEEAKAAQMQKLRRSLAMLRVQITSEVANCEGCVVVGSNCRSPDYQEKVVIPLDRPGPPVH